MRGKRAILLAVCASMIFCNVNTAFASSTEITTAGGVANSAVNLSIEDTGGGVEGEVFSAYVPAELPIKMDLEGNVVTPSSAKIINGVETKGIKVAAIDVEMLNNWVPASYDDDFSLKEINSKEVGISLRGDKLQQDGSFSLTEDNWMIPKNSFTNLEMNVKIPKQSEAGDKGDVSNIQFTMDWSGDDDSVGPAIPTGTYTLNFQDSENGTIVDKTELLTDEYGQIVSLPETLPDSGYSLIKWVDVSNNFEVKVGDYIYENMIIKPIFSTASVADMVQVTFIGENCTINGSNTVEVAKGTLFYDIAKPEVTGESGYAFSGYYTEDDTYISNNTIINSDITIRVVFNNIVVEDDAFYYGTLSGEIVINGINTYDLKANKGILKIPEEIEGLTVTAIGDEAFQYETDIVQVVLPDTLEEIQYRAFYNCDKLKSVSIPNSVTVLGTNTFESCDSLESVKTSILSESAFIDCISLNSVDISNGLEELPSRVFEKCSSLEEIDIPDSVLTLGSSAFNNCTALKYVGLPSNLQSISYGAFGNCSSLKSLNIPESVLEIKSEAFKNCTSLETVNIPDGITAIEEFTFKNCSRLKGIDLPSSLESIGDGAFENCTSLVSIEIPYGVTEVQGFNGCTSLSSITIPNSATSVGEFENCTSLQYLPLPDGVTEISELHGCAAIPNLELPESLKTIGYYAFSGDTLPDDFTIPSKVSVLGSGAFYGATLPDGFTLPNSVRTIGSRAFKEASLPDSFTLPPYVTYIDVYAFSNTTLPDNFKLGNYVYTIDSSAFAHAVLPNDFVIPACVASIKYEAFYRAVCNNIIIADSILTIGEEAFKDVEHITYNGEADGSPWGAKSIN